MIKKYTSILFNHIWGYLCYSSLPYNLNNITPNLFLTKDLKKHADGEGVEKREPSCTIGGNVNWYSHYREQYGGSLKN